MATPSSLKALLFLLLFATSRDSHAQNNPDKGFAVLELFTSEGCSSCPPADAVISDIRKDHKGSVFVLGFHVDYWDRLGWRDPYSDNDYTKRQSKYATALKLESVYTPQLIINGKRDLVGSDRSRLYFLASEAIKNKPTANVILSAKHTSDNKALVAYTLSGAVNEVLNIALVQSEASSNVKKGENAGRQLRHVNVVRVFKTIKPAQNTGEITLDLPPGVPYNNCAVIAYTQQSDMTITAATEARIE